MEAVVQSASEWLPLRDEQFQDGKTPFPKTAEGIMRLWIFSGLLKAVYVEQRVKILAGYELIDRQKPFHEIFIKYLPSMPKDVRILLVDLLNEELNRFEDASHLFARWAGIPVKFHKELNFMEHAAQSNADSTCIWWAIAMRLPLPKAEENKKIQDSPGSGRKLPAGVNTSLLSSALDMFLSGRGGSKGTKRTDKGVSPRETVKAGVTEKSPEPAPNTVPDVDEDYLSEPEGDEDQSLERRTGGSISSGTITIHIQVVKGTEDRSPCIKWRRQPQDGLERTLSITADQYSWFENLNLETAEDLQTLVRRVGVNPSQTIQRMLATSKSVNSPTRMLDPSFAEKMLSIYYPDKYKELLSNTISQDDLECCYNGILQLMMRSCSNINRADQKGGEFVSANAVLAAVKAQQAGNPLLTQIAATVASVFHEVKKITSHILSTPQVVPIPFGGLSTTKLLDEDVERVLNTASHEQARRDTGESPTDLSGAHSSFTLVHEKPKVQNQPTDYLSQLMQEFD